MNFTPSRQLWSAFVIYFIGLAYMLFGVDRSDTPIVLGMFGLLTLVYVQLIFSNISIRNVANIAITLRCLAWFAFPSFSDDIYRFMWDGSLILDGVNPYLFTPTEFIATHIQPPYEALFPQLNSSGYYSVYPAVIQFFSAFGALAANDPYLSSLLIKLPILVAEIGTLWMLPQILTRFRLDPRLYKLYALHPLVIIELCGNAHFEGVMIFFFVLSIRWLLSDQAELAGIALALAVATKLIPLLFFPFLAKAVRGRERWWFVLTFGLSSLILFIPVLQPTFVAHFLDSIDLYFRSFEFNASVYYILRYIGYLMVGYNAIAGIGPALLMATCVVLLYLWLRQKGSLRHAILQAGIGLTVYYLLSTTVHPWYLSMLLLLSVFFRKPYMVVWPTLAFLSYATYGNPGFEENVFLLVLEYGVVAATILWAPWIKRKLPLTLQ